MSLFSRRKKRLTRFFFGNGGGLDALVGGGAAKAQAAPAPRLARLAPTAALLVAPLMAEAAAPDPSPAETVAALVEPGDWSGMTTTARLSGCQLDLVSQGITPDYGTPIFHLPPSPTWSQDRYDLAIFDLASMWVWDHGERTWVSARLRMESPRLLDQARAYAAAIYGFQGFAPPRIPHPELPLSDFLQFMVLDHFSGFSEEDDEATRASNARKEADIQAFMDRLSTAPGPITLQQSATRVDDAETGTHVQIVIMKFPTVLRLPTLSPADAEALADALRAHAAAECPEALR